MAGLVLLTVVLTTFPSSTNDLWMHLALGREMWETRAVPRVESFSYAAAGQPLVLHEWLPELLSWPVYQLGGVNLLILGKVGWCVGLVLALGFWPPWRPAALPWRLLVLSLLVLQQFPFLILRPHLVGYAFALGSWWQLLRWRTGGPLWPLALWQIGWANCHGSFLLGPALALALAAGESLHRLIPARAWPLPAAPATSRPLGRLWAAVPGLAVVSLLNPYGWDLWRHPFQLTSEAVFMTRVYEWQSPFSLPFRQSPAFFLALGWVVLGLGAFLFRWRRDRTLDWAHLFLFLGLLALATRGIRHVYLFTLLTSPVLISQGPPGPAGAGRRVLVVGLVTVHLLVAAWVVTGVPGPPPLGRPFGLGTLGNLPHGPAAYLAERRVSGRIYHTYRSGALLAFHGRPELRITIDSRAYPYGGDWFEEVQAAETSGPRLLRFLRGHGIEICLLGKTPQGYPPAAATLATHRDWALVDFNDTWLLFLRRVPRFAGLIERDGYRLCRPLTFVPGASPIQPLSRYREEVRRLRTAYPDSVLGRFFEAEGLERTGDLEGALRLVEAGLDRDPPDAFLFEQAGRMAWRLGDRDRARRHLSRCRALEPDNPTARVLLQRIEAGE